MSALDDKQLLPYEPARGQTELYGEAYFEGRLLNDDTRLTQFRSEATLLRKYVPDGRILDVGCSTGEFLRAIGWQGPMFGMEISPFARAYAEAHGVRFDRDLFNVSSYFDCVVFRGTIQHVDEPFRFMKYAHRALRPGGFLFFLATPNLNSPVYRWKKTLPFLDRARNFYIPDDVNLPNALVNYGFLVREIRFPYRETPYCRLWRDHLRFVRNLFSKRYYPHAFWRSSMEIVAQKPGEVV